MNKENSNSQINHKPSAKKPLTKKWWFWVLIIFVAISLVSGLTDSNGNKGSSESKVEQKKKPKKDSTSSIYTNQNGDQTTTENAELISLFSKVKLGDISNKGRGGSSYKKIKQMLGSSPSNTASSEVSGIETELATWKYKGLTLVFTFVNKRAVGRSITGLRWKRNRKPITRKSYAKMSNGTASEDALKKWGVPDEITQIQILGDFQTKYTWFTGVNGNLGANVSLDFTNQRLTGKSQYGLK